MSTKTQNANTMNFQQKHDYERLFKDLRSELRIAEKVLLKEEWGRASSLIEGVASDLADLARQCERHSRSDPRSS